jgi:hypothetical protein
VLLFSNHRAKRRTVWVTLLGWVLALLTGIVNACLMQPQGLRTPVSATSSVNHRSAERGMRPAQPLAVEHGDQDGRAAHVRDTTDAAKAGCLKFCDDESSTVANSKTAPTDLPGPVLVASVDWRAAVPIAAVATWQSVERPASQGPPLVIRFLRLTI